MTVTATPSPAAADPKKSGATCVIACKLPNGLLAELMDTDPDTAMRLPDGVGGTKLIFNRIPYPGNEDGRLLIRGSAAQRRIETANSKGVPVDAPKLETVSNGFGLTFGVDKAWAEAWFKQNERYEPVRRGLIFMQGNAASARDRAKDEVARKSIDPLNPLRPAADIEPAKDEVRKAAGLAA